MSKKSIIELLRLTVPAEIAAAICLGVMIGTGGWSSVSHRPQYERLRAAEPLVHARPTQSNPPPIQHARRVADFGDKDASPEVRYMADWIAETRDAANYPFVIIDKKQTRVYVFDGAARLMADTPVLLGGAKGDDSVPGIGSRPVSQVRPAERTTPAGRFVAERGHDTLGNDMVWVDYDAGVSMHRVVTANPREKRLHRLATPTIDDNRIWYGCINIPVAFYETYVRPMFATHRAVVYILPEVKSLNQVFSTQYTATLQNDS